MSDPNKFYVLCPYTRQLRLEEAGFTFANGIFKSPDGTNEITRTMALETLCDEAFLRLIDTEAQTSTPSPESPPELPEQ